MEDNWLKQGDEPLFSDLLWSKPERKSLRGKLLIIGGHLHGFDQAALAYQNAVEAGAGEVKVVLPDKLKPILGKSLENAVFAPSTKSGTLSKDCASQLKSYGEWANTVLVIQTGENSETTLLITGFVTESGGRPLVLTDDVLDDIKHDMSAALTPPKLLVLSLNGLQKLFAGLGAKYTIKHDMGLRPLVLALLGEERLKGLNLVTTYDSEVVVAAAGKVATTKRAQKPDIAALAAWAATWWMWQPAKPLEAVTTAAFEF